MPINIYEVSRQLSKLEPDLLRNKKETMYRLVSNKDEVFYVEGSSEKLAGREYRMREIWKFSAG